MPESPNTALSLADIADRRRRAHDRHAELRARIMREVDPTGALDPDERQRRFDAAWRAHFARLAARGHAVQRRRRDARLDSSAELALAITQLIADVTPLTPSQRRTIAAMFVKAAS